MSRHEEQYQELDLDAPFAAGSTEQKDAWLGDRAREAMEFRVRRSEAQATLNAAAQLELDEERAWLETEASRHRFTRRDDVHAVLYGERKKMLGRRLTPNEADRIQRFAHHHWDALIAQAVA